MIIICSNIFPPEFFASLLKVFMKCLNVLLSLLKLVNLLEEKRAQKIAKAGKKLTTKQTYDLENVFFFSSVFLYLK